MPILTPLERIGTQVAEKYQLTGMLGRGGMGVVYHAVHRWTGRRVAVKIIDPSLADDPELGARFLNEARAAAAIAHPHVVDVLDMGRDNDGTLYQALELLEGETLSQRLSREGQLSPAETVRLLAPVMDALAHAHHAGIVHRDVKPGNVFLRTLPSGDTQAVLLDFGMAKLLDAQPVTTRSSAVLGTPHYMAPEQALGAGSVGPSADIWAMGTILYQCLSGKLPFGEGPPAAYLARVVYQDAPALASCSPALPLALCQVVDRALARDVARRQPSMGVLIEELTAALGGEREPLSSSLLRSTSYHRRSSRVRARVLAAAMLMLAAVALVLWLGREPVQAPSSSIPAAEPTPSPDSPAPTQVPNAPPLSPAPAQPSPPVVADPPPPARHERVGRNLVRGRRPPASPTVKVNPAPPNASEETLPNGMTDIY